MTPELDDSTPFDPPSTATRRCPKEIASAIIAVKKQVKQLGSDEKNDHGGYRYVSVDKFYERIGPMMAEAGLALLIDETETEVRVTETTDRSGTIRRTPWLFAQYSLAFMHEGGETSAPMRRSLAMPITGPQSYGAAQSYVEKQFLRQVFKIPTGEKDADETPQDQEAPARPQAARPQTNGATRTASPPPPPAPRHVNTAAIPATAEEPPEITAARQRVRMLIDRYDHRIKTAPHKQALELVMDDGRDELAEIEAAGEAGKTAAAKLRDKYLRRMAAFDEGVAA